MTHFQPDPPTTTDGEIIPVGSPEQEDELIHEVEESIEDTTIPDEN